MANKVDYTFWEIILFNATRLYFLRSGVTFFLGMKLTSIPPCVHFFSFTFAVTQSI